MTNCNICGVKANSEFCWRHKPKKQLKKSAIKKVSKKGLIKKKEKKELLAKDWEFYLSLWNSRPHICQSCEIPLGDEPRTYMFDHLIEKQNREDLRHEEGNIFICCLECHSLKTNGFPTGRHGRAILKAKIKYG